MSDGATALKDALADLSRAVQRDPGNAIYLSNLGVLYDSLRKFRPAEACFSRAIEQDPRDGSAWLNRGLCRIQEGGRRRAALADLDHAVALLPDQAEAWGHRGDLREVLGDSKGALEDLERAAKLDPNLAWVQGVLAAVLLQRGAVELAHGAADRALRLDPKQTAPLFIRGTAAGRLGDRAAAIRDLREYLRRAPAGPLAEKAREGLKRWGGR